MDISSSMNDLQLAVVENSLSPQIKEESVVRLYDVGRLRADEEDFEDGDDDENAEGDDDQEVMLGDDEDEEDDEDLSSSSDASNDETVDADNNIANQDEDSWESI